MKKILFNPKAAQEFSDATDYYNNEHTGLGDELHQGIHRALLLISRYPEVGVQINKQLHRFVIARFPYYIIYRCLLNDTIRILAIAHQKQKPKY